MMVVPMLCYADMHVSHRPAHRLNIFKNEGPSETTHGTTTVATTKLATTTNTQMK